MKIKTVYTCQNCGHMHFKWMGQCSQCQQWNTLVEEKQNTVLSKRSVDTSQCVPLKLSEITKENLTRISSDFKEFDLILGGGLVPGSIILIGGEPGIGKSTLLLHLAHHYTKQKLKLLYISGEESASQIALRADRLKIQSNEIYLHSETSYEIIEALTQEIKPQVLMIDSIHTLSTQTLESHPGSVGQIRECTHLISQLAKQTSTTVFIIGHVTKEGTIAGPKMLEHMVDVVLYFEDTQNTQFRILRSMKNRFGSTHEMGVFEMKSEGLSEIKNPSKLFLSERQNSTSGACVAASLEGTRPILVEIQALVTQSYLAIPRRTALGVDANRVSLLVAILEKRAGMKFYDQDIYLNLAGGLKLTEPALDLAICASLISSLTNKPIPSKTVFFGEVGLGGEIRSVSHPETRIKEAAKIGFETAITPKSISNPISGIKIIPLCFIHQIKDFI